MSKKKFMIPLALCSLLCFACAYIVVPADLMTTPTSTASRGWTGFVTNVGVSDAGDLHIDISIRNDTTDWSAMSAVEGEPAVLTTSDGKKTNCDTVFVGTGENRMPPGFQMRGYTGGTKKEPVTQLLYVECKGIAAVPGQTLSLDYTYITGPYDLHIPSIPVNETLTLNLDQIVSELKYPVAEPVDGLIHKMGDRIEAINSFSLILTDVVRTETGLELHWMEENPSDYPNYVHIGLPPVIGADGIVYGHYEDPSIAEGTIALPHATGEWTTSVQVPADVTGLYVVVSVETRQSKYFVSHVVDIADK